MNTKNSRTAFPVVRVVTTLAVLVIASIATAGTTYDLSWYTFDGGGGTISGGAFELSASIGQPDAGVPLTGGDFELIGGFWSAAGAEPDCSTQNWDFDFDGDVDLSDFSQFALCYGGPNAPQPGTCPQGIDADCDNDGDVDLSDFASFANAFTGPA